MSRARKKPSDLMAAVALKTELVAVLNGTSRIVGTDEWGDAERQLLTRWAADWTDADSEHASAWATVEAAARRPSGWRADTRAIFQDLIFRTVISWNFAKAAESGDDPVERQIEARRKRSLELAKAADTLAQYYRDYPQDPFDTKEILDPLLNGIRLLRPKINANSPPPIYELTYPSYHMIGLYERQAEILRRCVGKERISTMVISRKSERRVLKAFLHSIAHHMEDLCGTQANGKPHREIIAMLANICFPEEMADGEVVRQMLENRRNKGSIRKDRR